MPEVLGHARAFIMSDKLYECRKCIRVRAEVLQKAFHGPMQTDLEILHVHINAPYLTN
jgi:hypothetical protein